MSKSVVSKVLAVAALAAACGCVEISRKVTMLPTLDTPWGTYGHKGSFPGDGSFDGPLYAPSQLTRLYRVAKTDTLVSITERFTGNRDRWYEIYILNQKVISDAGGLKRGLVIVLPPNVE